MEKLEKQFVAVLQVEKKQNESYIQVLIYLVSLLVAN
jgi:hypothetical protein